MGYDNTRKKKLSYSAEKVRKHHRAQNLAAVFGTYGAGFVGPAIGDLGPKVDIYALWNNRGQR
jgi:hypothetical protein